MTFDATPVYLSAGDCRLADLIDLVSQKTDLADYPCACAAEQNVLVYDGARLRTELSRPAARPRVRRRAGPRPARRPGHRRDGRRVRGPVGRRPGHLAVRGVHRQPSGRRAARPGDHFAAAGQNDRIWNALEKLALRAPEVFADYYANDLIAAACRAWLGPGYQVTSQVNVVNPGGAAQQVAPGLPPGLRLRHQAARFPAHVAPAVRGADLAGRGGAHRHAGRDRPDDVPAALAEVPARLPGLAAARVPRVLRGLPRPAAAAQG